ncbi:MAG: response regulator, partial [Thermodesulfobacteriota bacterium]
PDGFDMIITDMTMPGKTGDKLAHAVKQIRKDIPVILCTGFSEQLHHRRDSIEVEGFLMKPINFKKTAEMIRRILDDSIE